MNRMSRISRIICRYSHRYSRSVHYTQPIAIYNTEEAPWTILNIKTE